MESVSEDMMDAKGIEEESNLDKGKAFLEREQHAQRQVGRDISQFQKKKNESNVSGAE